MRLSTIAEAKISNILRNVNPLMQAMPKSKIKHSTRVAKTLKKAKAGQTGILAGALHDYLERGGNPETLNQHIKELSLPAEIAHIVQTLSNDEKTSGETNAPLIHLQHAHAKINPNHWNTIVLIKLADRLDNLKKRARTKITSKYRNKSNELTNWLQSTYTGDPEPLNYLTRKIQKHLQPAAISPLETNPERT